MGAKSKNILHFCPRSFSQWTLRKTKLLFVHTHIDRGTLHISSAARCEFPVQEIQSRVSLSLLLGFARPLDARKSVLDTPTFLLHHFQSPPCSSADANAAVCPAREQRGSQILIFEGPRWLGFF